MDSFSGYNPSIKEKIKKPKILSNNFVSAVPLYYFKRNFVR